MKKVIFLFVLLSFAGIAKSQQEDLQELMKRKQYNQIVSYATQLQAADSSDFQTMYLIGQAFEGLLKYYDAYHFYQHCLTIDSTQVELLYSTARMAANLGKAEDAEVYFLKIWASDTTDFYANYQLARFYVQIGNDEKAVEYYEYLLEQDPDNPILLRAVGDCYYRMDDRFTAAEAYWFAFQNNKENAGLASTLVNSLLPLPLEDGIERALEVCDTALFYNPMNKTLLQNQGTALFMAKRYTEADSIFSMLLAMADSSYYNLKYGGFSKYYAGKQMDAIEPLEKAYLEDETAVDVCLFLGAALGRTYDRKRAYQLFDRVEELMQPNPAYVNLLTEFRGTSYYRDGRFHEASSLLYPLYQTNKRLDLLDIIWYCHGNREVDKLNNDDERARSMFANVLMATEMDKSQRNVITLNFIKAQLEKFRDEMFFRSMNEYPMIAPDNKKSTITAERLQELIKTF
jgi:tetratricopeptide (TPR) repeat protein